MEEKLRKLKMLLQEAEVLMEEIELEMGNPIQKSNEERVENALNQMGVSSFLKGYRYLKESILLLINSPEILEKGVTRELYPRVAETFGVSPINAERCMRFAIKTAFESEKGSNIYIKRVFGPRQKPPVVSEFVVAMANEIQKQKK